MQKPTHCKSTLMHRSKWCNKTTHKKMSSPSKTYSHVTQSHQVNILISKTAAPTFRSSFFDVTFVVGGQTQLSGHRIERGVHRGQANTSHHGDSGWSGQTEKLGTDQRLQNDTRGNQGWNVSDCRKLSGRGVSVGLLGLIAGNGLQVCWLTEWGQVCGELRRRGRRELVKSERGTKQGVAGVFILHYRSFPPVVCRAILGPEPTYDWYIYHNKW